MKKEIKKGISIAVLLILIALFSSRINAIPTPHGIDGHIFELDGITPVLDNTFFSIQDINSGEFISGVTKNNGRYSVSLKGNNGNTIIIRAWNKYNQINRTIILNSVMHDVDLYLNTSIPPIPPIIISDSINSTLEDKNYTYSVRASDENNDSLTYNLEHSPEGMRIDMYGVIRWTPHNDDVGKHNITLSVTDGRFITFQNYVLEVINVNDPPQIISFPNTSALEDNLYTYHLEVIDDDNSFFYYYLLNPKEGMEIKPNGTFFWMPNNDDVGISNITIIVTDNDLKDTQSFNLMVENTNDDFNITSTPLNQILEDEEYRYNISVKDIDGDTINYTLKYAQDGMKLIGSVLYWFPGNDDVGINNVSVEISDGTITKNHSFSIKVINVNDPPQIISGPVTSAIEDAEYKYDIKAIDPDINDSEILNYSIVEGPVNMTINSTGSLIWTPSNDDVGINNITIQVSDHEYMINQTFNIDVINTNDEFFITSVPNTTAIEDKIYQYNITAWDIDGDKLSFELESFPLGMTFDNHMIRWVPENDDVGHHEIIIQVTDGIIYQNQSFDLNVLNVNDPPVISSNPSNITFEDEPYIYNILVEDVDSEEFFYSLNSGPTSMKIFQNGTLSWTPSNDDVGMHSIIINVSDGELFDTQTINLRVINVNDPPIINSTPKKETFEDEIYEYTISAYDNDNESLFFELLNHPENMTLINRTIQWIPGNSDLGFYNISLLVSDGFINETQNFQLQVINVNDPPKVISTAPEKGYVNRKYEYQINISDIDSSEFNYTLIMGPSKMKVSKDGLLKWVPQKSNIGLNEISLEISDLLDSVQYKFNITIIDNSKKVISEMLGTHSSSGGGGYLLYQDLDNNINKSSDNSLRDSKTNHNSNSLIDKIIVSGKSEQYRIMELKSRPQNVNEINKMVYKYFWLDTYNKISNDNRIFFKVKKSWLKSNNANETEIVLNRYNNDSWKELNTALIDSNDDFFNFIALTPGFSFFAVSLKKAPQDHEIFSSGIGEYYVLSGIIKDKNDNQKKLNITITNLNSQQTKKIETGIGHNLGEFYTIIPADYGDNIKISVEDYNISKIVVTKSDIKGIELIIGSDQTPSITGRVIKDIQDKKFSPLSASIVLLIFIVLIISASFSIYIIINKRNKIKKS